MASGLTMYVAGPFYHNVYSRTSKSGNYVRSMILPTLRVTLITYS